MKRVDDDYQPELFSGKDWPLLIGTPMDKIKSFLKAYDYMNDDYKYRLYSKEYKYLDDVLHELRTNPLYRKTRKHRHDINIIFQTIYEANIKKFIREKKMYSYTQTRNVWKIELGEMDMPVMCLSVTKFYGSYSNTFCIETEEEHEKRVADYKFESDTIIQHLNDLGVP